LVELWLDENNITTLGAHYLLSSLSTNIFISWVSLSGNKNVKNNVRKEIKPNDMLEKKQ